MKTLAALLGRIPWLRVLPYAAVFAGGFALAWWMYRPAPAPRLVQQPEIRQADQSLVLKTQPATERQVRKAIPALPQLPPGATLIAGAEGILAPHDQNLQSSGSNLQSSEANPQSSMPRPRIRVDVALLKMADGSERIALSSPDADVVGGVDMPVQRTKGLAQERGWGVGGFWNPSTHAYGPMVTKDWGPLRFGATGRIEHVQVPGIGAISNNGVDLSVIVHF